MSYGGRKPIISAMASTSFGQAIREFTTRWLYFFHQQAAVVVSHGLTKEWAVPPREIDLAMKRKQKFEANPKQYTFRLKG